MRPSSYVSNIRWLLKTFKPLISNVENWREVFLFYLLPERSVKTLTIQLRNGTRVRLPGDYIFQPIAETLLQNTYEFHETSSVVVVDVGASIGDFTLMASAHIGSHIYSFEPDPSRFRYMRENVSSNKRSVQLFNSPATADRLKEILDEEQVIDFLKVDCEGCEYNLLLLCPIEILLRIRVISMEVHSTEGHNYEQIFSWLRTAGFHVRERRQLGEGHYLYASRP